jgi:hypothetical protein
MIVARLRGNRMRTKLDSGCYEAEKPCGRMLGEDTTVARMIALRTPILNDVKMVVALRC